MQLPENKFKLINEELESITRSMEVVSLIDRFSVEQYKFQNLH